MHEICAYNPRDTHARARNYRMYIEKILYANRHVLPESMWDQDSLRLFLNTFFHYGFYVEGRLMPVWLRRAPRSLILFEPRVHRAYLHTKYGIHSNELPFITNTKNYERSFEEDNMATMIYPFCLDAPFSFTLMQDGVCLSRWSFYVCPKTKSIFVDQIQGPNKARVFKRARRERMIFKGKFYADSFMLYALMRFAQNINAPYIAIRKGCFGVIQHIREIAMYKQTPYDAIAQYYGFSDLNVIRRLWFKINDVLNVQPRHYYFATAKSLLPKFDF